MTQVTNTNSFNVANVDYEYDEHKRLVVENVQLSDGKIALEYQYRNFGAEPSSEVEKVTIELEKNNNGSIKTFDFAIENHLDELKRLKTIEKSYNTSSLKTDFAYFTNENGVTVSVPSKITTVFQQDDLLNEIAEHTYTYNKMNKIVGVHDNLSEKESTYLYDLFGRLIRENNQGLNQTVRYSDILKDIFDTNNIA